MLLQRARILPVCLVLASGVGCSSESPPGEHAPRWKQQGIFGGTLDATHEAVVYLTDGASACTGTIIARSGTIGVVLTAAHCTGMQYVIQAQDANAVIGTDAGVIHPVTDFLPNPQYNINQPVENDFALLSFSGADASTPIIPVIDQAEDTLAVGTNLEFVGYGLTESSSSGVRRHVTVPVAELSATLITVSMTSGTGPCEGDSGGPALFQVGGVPKVAGIVAAGSPNCDQVSWSGRVSSVSSFIQSGISQLTTLSCTDCTAAASSPSGACVAEAQACIQNNDCGQLAQCLGECATPQCRQDCAAQHPSSVALYDAFFECTCTACAVECVDQCPEASDAGADAGPVDSGTGGAESDAAAGGSGGSSVGGSAGAGTGGSGTGGKKSAPAASDDDGGCGCRVADNHSSSAWAWLAGLGLVALQARRRITRR